MKLYHKLFLFTLLSFVIGFSSCKTTKDAAVKTQKVDQYKPLTNSLLWKIEGKNLTNPSYLYGTIHLIDSKDYFLPKGTLTAIDNTDKMVFEIDMNEMNDMSNMMGLMTKAFMSDNQSLRTLLNDADYKVVEDHFEGIGLPLMMLERIKPMFLSVFASGDMDPSGLQNGSMKSYEMEFMEMANNKEMTTGGLETIEFQMSVFDSIPYKAQADMLVESIKNSDAGSDEFATMISMYKGQKINDMVSMISEESEGLSDFEDILLHKRNEQWIGSMRTLMSESPVFFAVGAGHLAGPKGVVHLLRKEGYRLTPISHKS